MPIRSNLDHGARRVALGFVTVALSAAALVGCGDGGAGDGRPTIVVTTPVLGDLVANVVGEAASVTTIIPSGASPHEFQASARQARDLREADLVIVNGGGLEAGLDDVIDAARGDGVPVHEAIADADPMPYGEDDHGAGHDHDHGDEGLDPHVLSDPVRAEAVAVGVLDAIVAEVPDLDETALRDAAAPYLAELGRLDVEVGEILDVVPDEHRVLVTNHESLGYFAHRYGFELAGAVIPATTTGDAGNARDLEALAGVVRDEGVPAIFADTSSPTDLAEALAAEAGDVEVVALYTESLGEPGSGADTYVGMTRTNAERIAAALGD